jgi:hypothetical protein
MGDNLDVVRNIARAVKEGLVHIGQEVFVAAFARNDEADYGAKPVLSCPHASKARFESRYSLSRCFGKPGGYHLAESPFMAQFGQ